MNKLIGFLAVAALALFVYAGFKDAPQRQYALMIEGESITLSATSVELEGTCVRVYKKGTYLFKGPLFGGICSSSIVVRED